MKLNKERLINSRTFIIKTTNMCNLNCSYCYTKKNRGSHKQNLDIDLVEKIIAQASELPEKNINFIWHGGEPLLRGVDFFEHVVAFQKKYEKLFFNGIQTNGLLLNSEWTRFFRRYKFSVGVSIDFPAIVHNKKRKLSNKKDIIDSDFFQYLVNRIRLLEEYNVNFGLISVLSEILPDPSEVINFILQQNIRAMSFNTEFHTGTIIDTTVSDKIANFFKELYKQVRDHRLDITIREVTSIIEYISSFSTVKFCHCDEEFCGYSYNTITENGDIYLCCDKFINKQVANLGNVEKSLLRDIFKSKKTKSLLKSLEKQRREGCQGCDIMHFCNGGCIADALTFQKKEERTSCVQCASRREFYKYILNDFCN